VRFHCMYKHENIATYHNLKWMVLFFKSFWSPFEWLTLLLFLLWFLLFSTIEKRNLFVLQLGIHVRNIDEHITTHGKIYMRASCKCWKWHQFVPITFKCSGSAVCWKFCITALYYVESVLWHWYFKFKTI